MNIIYSAIFLDEISHKKLLKFFPPIHEKVFAHHSTIEFKPKSVDFEIGEDVELIVLGEVSDEKCQTVLVENSFIRWRAK